MKAFGGIVDIVLLSNMQKLLTLSLVDNNGIIVESDFLISCMPLFLCVHSIFPYNVGF